MLRGPRSIHSLAAAAYNGSARQARNQAGHDTQGKTRGSTFKMTATAKVLIVDDDPRICRTLRSYLKREGYSVAIASNGEEMWQQFSSVAPDLILLDVVLPGDDGISLARELRKSSDVGIIMLTGKNDPVDQIIGLEMGADDYVTKPFDERQLLARIRSLLRRSTNSGGSADARGEEKKKRIIFDGFELDLFRHELVSPSGKHLTLTSHEFRLLEVFVQNSGGVLSRDQIMQHMYDRDWSQNDRSVDVLVGKLRKKIEDDPAQPKIILTIRNFGYKFAARVNKTGLSRDA
jgi:DNA-binding response OmpR family regulator